MLSFNEGCNDASRHHSFSALLSLSVGRTNMALEKIFEKEYPNTCLKYIVKVKITWN